MEARGVGRKKKGDLLERLEDDELLDLVVHEGGMVPTRNPGNLAVFLNSVMTVLYLSATIFLSTWGEARAAGV